MKNSKPIKPYQLPLKLKVRGATAPDGIPYISIAASDKRARIPREAFSGTGSAALKMLRESGIPLLSKEWAECRDMVANVVDFPIKPLISRPGWNFPHFAMCDGTVFSGTAGRPVVLFPPDDQKCAYAGSIYEWRRITSVLKDQHIPTFITLAAYAGPVLALSKHVLNVGFELAGPGGIGKSTLQRLAAAVSGPADSPSGINYWITANATIHGLEDVMTDYKDMPLIIEEANLFAAADHVGSRAAKMNELVFKLADGTSKRRFGSGQPNRSRFVFITSTNEPLAQLLAGSRVAVAEAATDRLLTIPVDVERRHGVFDFLPEKFRNGAELADYFNTQIRKCYGVSIRHFIRRLVMERQRHPEEISEHIDKCIARFRREAGVNGNDGSETRAADSFGLVYAAGELAVKYRAISKKVKPLDAALSCYRLNRASRTKIVDPTAKLREIADSYDALQVRDGRLPELTDDELNAFPAILRERRDGTEEALFTPEQLRRAFPDQRSFFAHPKVREWLVAEEGRKQTKRQIRSNRRNERVHCFRIPRRH